MSHVLQVLVIGDVPEDTYGGIISRLGEDGIQPQALRLSQEQLVSLLDQLHTLVGEDTPGRINLNESSAVKLCIGAIRGLTSDSSFGRHDYSLVLSPDAYHLAIGRRLFPRDENSTFTMLSLFMTLKRMDMSPCIFIAAGGRLRQPQLPAGT